MRSEQEILDQECARYAGNGGELAKHLTDVHGVRPEVETPLSPVAWSAVAHQHVIAHQAEEQALAEGRLVWQVWSHEVTTGRDAGYPYSQPHGRLFHTEEDAQTEALWWNSKANALNPTVRALSKKDKFFVRAIIVASHADAVATQAERLEIIAADHARRATQERERAEASARKAEEARSAAYSLLNSVDGKSVTT